jgi:hypothetical protein
MDTRKEVMPDGYPYAGRLISSLFGSEAMDIYESRWFEGMTTDQRLAIVQAMYNSNSIEKYVGEGEWYGNVMTAMVEFAGRRVGSKRVERA